MPKQLKLVAAGVIAVMLAIPTGAFLYIHFVEPKAPARLSLSTDPSPDGSATSGTAAAAGGLSGTWKATPASQVGYRVNEVLFGQVNVAVGRTSDVSGTLTIGAGAVTAADLTVDMTTMTSDKPKRDEQFRGRIMNTAAYPTAAFRLTKPVPLASVPGDQSPVPERATGQLTLRGVTRTVTVDLKAQRNGGRIEVNGAIPIAFADWGIPNPTFGPVSTEDHGLLELLIVAERAR